MDTDGEGILRILSFLRTGIWRTHSEDLPGVRGVFLNGLKIFLIALRKFRTDNCPLRASALTYYTALSIVPVFALIFAIAKGFGFEKLLQRQILQQIPEHEDIMLKILDFARSLLQNTRGGLIAVIGVLFLLWTIIKVVGHVEFSLNEIWQVKRQRSLPRKFTDYLSITLICPFIILLSSSATVFINTHMAQFAAHLGLQRIAGHILLLTTTLSPYVLMWILFALIYLVIPNTRVRLPSAVAAALVAGTIYQVTQLVFLRFQVGVSRFNAIYGGFSALPLLLIWIQLSWMIALMGAEISFAIQNVETYEPPIEALRISPLNRRIISLAIIHLIVKRFFEGKEALSSQGISRSLGIPFAIVVDVTAQGVAGGLICLTETADGTGPAFLPASDIDGFTISRVLEMLENVPPGDLPASPSDDMDRLTEALASFGREMDRSPDNRLLKDI